MVERVPTVTRQLLGRIPRLEGVLEILDSNSAQPREDADGVAEGMPIGARVLRVAADYAELESRGASRTVALGAMRSRRLYDPGLLDALTKVIGVAPAAVLEIALAELRVGMTLADDVRSVRDELLLARGQHVTERLVERLRNLGADGVLEPLRVFERQSGR